MVRSTLVFCALAFGLTLAADTAQAQDVSQPEATGRFRLGPVRFTPAVQLTNFGVDTNVFNEFDDPKQDFTAGLGPAVDFWLRMGRARVSGKAGLDYNYFHEYESQRYVGTANTLRVSLPFSRLTPFVEGGYTNTRQRPGYEIDARAKRTLSEGRAGLDLRLGGRTTATLAAGRKQYRFGADDEFLGTGLSEALDNDSDAFELTLARQLTPLTALVVTAEQRRDRFLYSSLRDSDATKVVTGFDFKPFALISGTIRVGWRQFETLGPTIPDYAGVIASGQLLYALRATRFDVRLRRDVEYSFHQFEPYYLLTDVQLEVTQRITSHWDVVARGGRQLLDYRAVASVGDLARVERQRRIGGGVGYRLGEFIRVGVDVNRDRRTSDVTLRQYDAWRVGGSITYGIKAP
jgi:opacity protein-like surface antigen